MKNNICIEEIHAIEILDSRGNPTIQVKVKLKSGHVGIASVPSGASTGSFEAIELRDGDVNRYGGKGVLKAIHNINNKIAQELIGKNPYKQKEIDQILINLDGTKNKGKLGANAILGVSLAVAKASASSLDMELYRYLGGINAKRMPVPMMNILNGGKHSDNNISIQEFMIVPIGGKNFKEYLEMGVRVYNNLKNILKEKGYTTNVGDEGGFAPNLLNEKEALDFIIEAINKSSYIPGKDIAIALDIAATEMYKNNIYIFWKEGISKATNEMIEYVCNLANNYSILSIEDPLFEEDWNGWKKLTKELGSKIQLVGDDLFVTNVDRLNKGINLNVANSILIKPNQIGTLTETMETIEIAQRNGYDVIISHRSGETEDTYIADLAVAVNAGKVKIGAPCRTDRTVKYNRLLTIEDELFI